MNERDRIGQFKLSELPLDTDTGEIRDIPELLVTLDQLGLGRAILFTTPTPEKGKYEVEIAGYVLPTTQDETEHLVIMRSGEMHVVAPMNDEQATVISYKRFHRPQSTPYRWELSDQIDDGGRSLLDFNMNPVFHSASSRIVMSNLEGPSEAFNQRIDAALETSHFLRDQRIAGMADSRAALLKQVSSPRNFTPIPNESGFTPVQNPVQAEVTLPDSAETCLSE